MRRVARAADEPDFDVALRNMPRLTHLAAVQSNEIGVLRGERRGMPLARGKCAVDGAGKCVKVLFDAAVRCRARAAHASPPNTSTFVNTHAGAACPTRIVCDGSPLPQNGVPSTRTVSALPTRERLRQNSALMPR